MAAQQAAGGVNYIGCRISLVSKSDIRYEGTLLELNSGSISLGRVRSFGTEDRPVAQFVPPREDIYEYVVFYTPDIKDLIVRSAPEPLIGHDPAILEAKALNPSASGPPAISTGHGAAAPGVTTGGLNYSTAALPSHQPAAGLGPGGFGGSSNVSQGALGLGLAAAAAGSGGGHNNESVSLTGSHVPRNNNNAAPPAKDVTSSASYMDPFAINPQQYLQRNQEQRNAHAGGGNRQSESEGYSGGESRTYERGGRSGGYDSHRGGYNNNANNYRGGSNQGYTYNNRGGRGGYVQGQGYGNRGGGYGQQQSRGAGGYHGGGSDREQRSGYNQPHGNIRNNYQSVQISAGGGPAAQRPQAPAAGATPAVPRANLPEFDFESANTAFEEIEEKMKNVHVSGHSPTEDGEIKDGETNTSSGERGSSGEQDENKDTAGAGEPGKFYDPNRFFDNISCDALEKEKGSGGRTDWRKERQLNVETFGTSGPSSRVYENQSNRGGRGGGYSNNYGGRGGGGGYRGEYSGGGYRDDGYYGTNRGSGGYRGRGRGGYNNNNGYQSSQRGGQSVQR